MVLVEENYLNDLENIAFDMDSEMHVDVEEEVDNVVVLLDEERTIANEKEDQNGVANREVEEEEEGNHAVLAQEGWTVCNF